VRADVLFAELASDFGGELVVGGGPEGFKKPAYMFGGVEEDRREQGTAYLPGHMVMPPPQAL